MSWDLPERLMVSAEPAFEVTPAAGPVPRLVVNLSSMGAGLGRWVDLNQELK